MIDTGMYTLGGFHLIMASNFGGLIIMAKRKIADRIPILVNKAFHVPMPTPSNLQISR
jgi:hypothetical protein